MTLRTLTGLAGGLLLCTTLRSADPTPDFKSTMTQPGKILFSNDLT